MKSIATVSLVVFSAAGLAAAAGSNNVRGEYIEARTADVYTGACFANSEVGNTGDVAVMGWRVGKGSFNGVTLDGLNVVAVDAKAHAAWQRLAESIYPKIRGPIVPADAFDEALRYRDELRKAQGAAKGR